MKSGIRFSSFLMASFVSQAAACVLLISLCLYFFFDGRITSEFRDKLRAQRGQAELILEKRMEYVQRRLKDLSLDNTIRVTMMLGVAAQLDERIKTGYPAENGIYFFVRSGEGEEWLPRAYRGLDQELVRASFPTPGNWNHGRREGTKRFVWYFSAPVMRRTELLGTAFALYDPTEDQELANSIRHTMEASSDLVIRGPTGPVSVKTGALLTLPAAAASHLEAFSGREEHALTPLTAFPDISFLASLTKLQQERNKLSMLLGLLSLLVITVSASLSILIGNQISRPLKKLAAKAQEISEQKKESLFEVTSLHPEFNQLSHAFNSMITSLTEEKNRYTELLRHIGDAVYILDREGQIVEANEATTRQLSWGASLTGRTASDFLPSADLAFLLSRLDGTGEPSPRGITLRSRHLTADGKRIPVEINSRAISYGGQQVILNVARDLTSRMEAEQALRESEERYRSILENIAEGYFEIDPAGSFCFFNQAFCAILDRSAGELHGTAHAGIAAPESATRLAALIDTIHAAGAAARLSPYTIVRPDGSERLLDLSLSLIKTGDTAPAGIRGVARDITEQLQIEREKSQLKLERQRGLRLEALGTLAGGIAHDFNNLLAAVLGYAELSLLERLPEGELPLFLQRIKEVAFRGRDLVAQILAFSRRDEAVRKPVDIVPVVKETLKMLAPALPAQLELRAQIDSDGGLILADPTQIHQVLMNLCINARDALRGKGGVLEVTLERTEIDAAGALPSPRPAPGRYLLLRVRDTGLGMSSEVLEHIFEPFFTTKKPNEGTGMGLAVVHGIVTHHGGKIFVSSQPGAGSCFELYFPLLAGETEQMVDSESPLPSLPRTLVVLLVDDEEDLVQTGTRMLEHLGCKVTSTTSSHEALQIFRRNPDLFDLVITDQVMSELTGIELAQEILALRPQLPVVLFTGYTEGVAPEEALKKGVRRFVLKPLSIEELAAILHEAIPAEPS